MKKIILFLLVAQLSFSQVTYTSASTTLSEPCKGDTQVFTATNGQTDFVLLQSAALVQVFKDRVFQIPDVDYTYTEATKTIAFSSGLDTGDSVYVYANCVLGASGGGGGGTDTDVSAITTSLDANKDFIINVTENGNTINSTALNIGGAWDNTNGTPADQASTDINYMSGSIGVGTTTPVKQVETTEDIRVHSVDIGRGGGGLNSNTRIGLEALLNNTGGFKNTAIGTQALRQANARENTAVGFWALRLTTTGIQNTAVGTNTLSSNTTGAQNTAVGDGSLNSNTTGIQNTGMGRLTLFKNTTGSQNTAMGQGGLSQNTTGSRNTADGFSAMRFNTTGTNNTALGYRALHFPTAGNDNTILGFDAALKVANNTDFFNIDEGIFIGSQSKGLVDNSVNEIVIGFNAIGNGSNTATLGNGNITDVYLSGDVHADAYLITSDERLKHNFSKTGLTKVINGNTINLYSYQRTYNGKKEIGVKAQDVLKALKGLDKQTIALIIISKKGVDNNATLSALNKALSIKAKTILEAYKRGLNAAVQQDLEANGFVAIKRKAAELEYKTLQEKTNLTDKEQDRLARYKDVDFTGRKIFETYNVYINDLLSINTTALSWITN